MYYTSKLQFGQVILRNTNHVTILHRSPQGTRRDRHGYRSIAPFHPPSTTPIKIKMNIVPPNRNKTSDTDNEINLPRYSELL